MAEKFEWPCDKRKAHAPHQLGHEEDCEEEDEVMPFCSCKTWCLGVKVHPATQIGGNYKETRP